VSGELSLQRVVIVGETDRKGHVSALTCELIGLGKRLVRTPAPEVCAVFFGRDPEQLAQQATAYGADKIVLFEAPALSNYNPEVFLGILEKYCTDENPAVILLGHTPLGADLGVRLAFSLGAAIFTDCTGLSLGGNEEVLFTKPIYGGNTLVDFSARTSPGIATVRPGTGAVPEPDRSRKVEILRLPCGGFFTRIEKTAKAEEDAGGLRLEEARVIVSGGRGMGSADGFEMLSRLASILGGAVGTSRPPCDLGWAPQSAQVGITGRARIPGSLHRGRHLRIDPALVRHVQSGKDRRHQQRSGSQYLQGVELRGRRGLARGSSGFCQEDRRT